MPQYPHILQRYFNTPLLIEESKLHILNSEVFLKLLNNEPIDRSTPTPDNISVTQDIKNNVFVIPVHGSLVNKNGAGSSGVTSYESIKQDIYTAIENGATIIGFDISSPGGEASGNFPLANFIASLPTKYGIDTFAFTDSSATSAAYAIAAACKKIYATDMAHVGSIGTVATLVDVSAADSADGIKYHIIRSKDEKAAYNPHEPVSTKVLEQVKAEIMAWDNKFNSIVNEFRPQLSVEDIIALKGRSMSASEGVALGLVDTIVNSIEDVFASLLDTSATQTSSTARGIINMTNEETLAKLVQAQTELASLKASYDLDVKQAVKLETDRCLKILEAKTTFGVTEATAINAISKNFSLDMVTTMFEEIKATMDAATPIVTATAPQGSVTATTIADLQQLATAQQTAKNNDLGNGAFSMNDLVAAMGEIGAERLGGM